MQPQASYRPGFATKGLLQAKYYCHMPRTSKACIATTGLLQANRLPTYPDIAAIGLVQARHFCPCLIPAKHCHHSLLQARHWRHRPPTGQALALQTSYWPDIATAGLLPLVQAKHRLNRPLTNQALQLQASYKPGIAATGLLQAKHCRNMPTASKTSPPQA